MYLLIPRTKCTSLYFLYPLEPIVEIGNVEDNDMPMTLELPIVLLSCDP